MSVSDIAAIPVELADTQMKVIILSIRESSAESPLKIVLRDKTIGAALRDKLVDSPGRPYRVEYADQMMVEELPDDDPWCGFQSDTTGEALTQPPKIRITFLSAAQKFHSSAFLRQRRGDLKLHIEGYKLRIPQEEALAKIRAQVFEGPHSEFWVCMPTGCGKTVVLALAPFMLNIDRVLVITPGTQIRDQVHDELRKLYNAKHAIGASGQLNIQVDKYDPKCAVKSDVIVANVQALIKKRTTKRELACVQPIMETWIPDLVIVDEGHHKPAESWELVWAEAKRKNPNVKLLSLTATPQRGDGVRYGLVSEDQFYIYYRQEARLAKYIKETKVKKVDVQEFMGLPSKFSGPRLITKIVETAVDELLSLRRLCGNKPLRLLISTMTNDNAKTVADLCNKLSTERNWGLRAEAITGKVEAVELARRRNQFAADYAPSPSTTKSIIDIAVQCKMLSEGYDNPWVYVTAFVMGFQRVSLLSQIHGRALRKNSKVSEFVHGNTSVLVVPDVEGVWAAVVGYTKGPIGDDEQPASLLSVPPEIQLREMHSKCRKLPSGKAVEVLKAEYSAYHDAYAERRERWNPVPADHLATLIAKKFPVVEVNFSVADFGCGRDGLFVQMLAERVSWRPGKGKVTVFAIDVLSYNGADALTEVGARPREGIDDVFTVFECKTMACDYAAALPDPAIGFVDLDAAVFCLSLMASNSLSSALITAAKVVKTGGSIYIVLDTTKFDILPSWPSPEKKTALDEWCGRFNEKCAALSVGLKILDHFIAGTGCVCGYLTIRTTIAESDREHLGKKLEGFELNTLRNRKRKKRSSDDSASGLGVSGTQAGAAEVGWVGPDDVSRSSFIDE
eukprot:m.88171 g.88171  ORF g.88171 m.88171 type:complete len:848 (+) comp19970_c0_seq2:1214-3757(+)